MLTSSAAQPPERSKLERKIHRSQLSLLKRQLHEGSEDANFSNALAIMILSV